MGEPSATLFKGVQTQGTDEVFLQALEVWIKKPHVVNRRLCGASMVLQESYHGNMLSLTQLKHMCCELVEVDAQSHRDKLCDILSGLRDIMAKERSHGTEASSKLKPLAEAGLLLCLRDLVPKNTGKQQVVRELLLLGKVCMTISVYIWHHNHDNVCEH